MKSIVSTVLFQMHNVNWEWRESMRQRQHDFRGEHTLLVLAFQVAVIPFHHLVNARQSETMVPAAFAGRIALPFAPGAFSHCIHDIEIELPPQNIDVYLDEAFARVFDFHTGFHGIDA